MGELIQRPRPEHPLTFDGERYTTSFSGQTAIEHWHRYLFARELVRGLDVLDVACGEGYGAALLAQTANSVVGVEISAMAVSHARAAYQRDNLRFQEGSALAIPLGEATVDLVVSFETIEHFREHDMFVAEVRRVLRPGGLFVVSTPDRDVYSPASTPANPFHRQELTAAEFRTLLSRHFAHVAMHGQRTLLGSALLAEAGTQAPSLVFERRGGDHFEASVGSARALYLVALASDAELPASRASIYVDTDQLGPFDGPMLKQMMASNLTPELAEQVAEQVARLEAKVVELLSYIAERDRQIAHLSSARSALDDKVSEFKGYVAERDRVLSERDAAVDRLRDDVAERDREIAALKAREDAARSD